MWGYKTYIYVKDNGFPFALKKFPSTDSNKTRLQYWIHITRLRLCCCIQDTVCCLAQSPLRSYIINISLSNRIVIVFFVVLFSLSGSDSLHRSFKRPKSSHSTKLIGGNLLYFKQLPNPARRTKVVNCKIYNKLSLSCQGKILLFCKAVSG